MDFSKSPPELVERFGVCLPNDPSIRRRQMFGYPSATVGGHMFASLFHDGVIVRLPSDQLAELLALPGARPFEPMPGRPMKGYAVLPPSVSDEPDALRGWLARAFEGAAALPPKER